MLTVVIFWGCVGGFIGWSVASIVLYLLKQGVRYGWNLYRKVVRKDGVGSPDFYYRFLSDDISAGGFS